MKSLVGDYKYNSQIAAAPILANLLANRLTNHWSKQTIIVPVPTIAHHIRQRGFDHTLILARQLAKSLKLSVNSNLLFRTNNLSQHTLSKTDRKKLIKKSIAIKLNQVAPKQVLLLDDIWTTGSSLITAARLLKSAGVKDVVGCVIVAQPK